MVRRNGAVNLRMDPNTLKALRAQAKARGVSLKTYLQRLATGAGKGKATVKRTQSGEEFEKMLDKFFAEHPEALPALPADFSRADIYHDHD